MEVKIKKLHQDAVIPTYGTEGAACFDLTATSKFICCERWTSEFGTGLAFEIPEGYVMLVYGRSGFAFQFNEDGLVNGVGVIDSDYRGEVRVKYWGDMIGVSEGDRIAQAMIIPYPRIEFVVSDELSVTDRGENGFGSTGQ